jgi:hypothetical protein
VDLIHRPYIYKNTPLTAKRAMFEHLRITDITANGYQVEVPRAYLGHLRDHLGFPPGEEAMNNRFMVNHMRSQLPFMRSKSLHEHFMYCQDMSQRMSAVLPIWQEIPSNL